MRVLQAKIQIISNLKTFEPIEVQTRSAPQNDRLNLSFVIAENWLEMVEKRPFWQTGGGGCQ